MTDLTSLIARVEALSGPDREVDLEIARALVPDVIVGKQYDRGGPIHDFTYWEYTASLDAVVALAERVLPGWGWGVAVIDGRATAMSVEPDIPDATLMDPWPRRFESAAPTPTLALLLALLRAVQAQQETEA